MPTQSYTGSIDANKERHHEMVLKEVPGEIGEHFLHTITHSTIYSNNRLL